MSEETFTLYKLMILFMLDNLDFPMTTSQLSEFFIHSGYTSYFHLQRSINELLDAGFLRGETVRNTTNFYLTDSGKETIGLFEDKISPPIKKDILDYFAEHKYELRKEVDITARYYPLKKGEYMVEAGIREKGTSLLELKLNVISKEQAIAVCDRWKDRCDGVYGKVMELLLLDQESEV